MDYRLSSVPSLNSRAPGLVLDYITSFIDLLRIISEMDAGQMYLFVYQLTGVRTLSDFTQDTHLSRKLLKDMEGINNSSFTR